MTNFGFSPNFNQNELLNFCIQNLAAAPASPRAGQIYYNTTVKSIFVWDGVGWIDMGGSVRNILAAAGSPLTITNAAGIYTLNINNVTATANGIMLAADKVKLDAATAAATPSTLVFRDATGATALACLSTPKVIGLSTPINPTDAANKQYVDMAIQGLDNKDSTRVATTANIVLSGTQTIDGIVLVAGDRVLVKNQTNPIENGIYIVAAAAWTRATDMPAAAKCAGAHIFVEEGATLADTGWVCNSDKAADVAGTNPLTWTQFSAAGQMIAGAGLVKNGNTFDIVAADNSVIVNADSIAVRVDNTTILLTAAGLAVKDASITAAKLAAGITDTTMVGGAGVTLGVKNYVPIGTAQVQKGSQVLNIALVANTPYTVPHPFGTAKLSSVQVRLAATNEPIGVQTTISASAVTLTASAAYTVDVFIIA